MALTLSYFFYYMEAVASEAESKACSMKNRHFKRIITAVRSRSLFFTVKQAIFNRCPICFIKNRGIRDLQKRDMLYRKLYRKYRPIIDNAENTSDTAHIFPKIIWWCWLQGYDQAPELARCCYESLQRNMPGYDIKIVTSENLSDYITLPDYITEKFNRGMFGPAHYSDIIRLGLLVEYGGIWIDATVLCTDNEMCHVFEKAPLFVYQILTRNGNPSVASSWLIAAERHSPVLALTRDLLLEYWKHYRILEHYFLFHLFFAMAVKRFPEIWYETPVYDNVSPRLLVHELDRTYSAERYAKYKKYSSFHKLSNKKSYSKKEGTFYDVLISRRQF